MNQQQAESIADTYGINLSANFYALPTDAVERILEAAKDWKYRKPRNANGSRARYFHAALVRAAFPKTELEHVTQTRTAYGWEDVCCDATRGSARLTLREYRENQPEYAHRLITRRVRIEY